MANLLALNSFENRVWQVGQEDAAPVVVKFYRAARWSDEAILEEHAFTLELAAREIPVVAPLRRAAAPCTISRICAWPSIRGAAAGAPELEDPRCSEWLGRFMGAHPCGGCPGAPPHARRWTWTVSASVDFILDSRRIPEQLEQTWCSVAEQALDAARLCFERAGRVGTIRLHGDCHAGNVLWTPDGPHFVDFDDARMGPAVQDLWMLLSGDEQAMARQLDHVLAGYEVSPTSTAAALPDRGLAYPEIAALRCLAGAALGRPGLSGRISMVRWASLLGRAHPRPARTGCAHGGRRWCACAAERLASRRRDHLLAPALRDLPGGSRGSWPNTSFETRPFLVELVRIVGVALGDLTKPASTARKASTTSGSKCVPDPPRIEATGPARGSGPVS